MAGHQAQNQRRLAIMVEIRPVHRHQGVLTAVQLMRHPAGKAVPHVDAVVAEQPVHLLDGVFGHQAACLRQGLADHHHRERCRRHHPKCCAGQSVDPLGMQIRAIEFANKRAHFAQTSAPLTRPAHVHVHAPAQLSRNLYKIRADRR